MEIQQALANRGYYKAEVNGVWGPESVAALKQFQEAQNLPPTGKYDSLSLRALGLAGPKRDAANPNPPPVVPPSTTSPEAKP